MSKNFFRIATAVAFALSFFAIGYSAGERMIRDDPVPVYERAAGSAAPEESFPPEEKDADIFKISLSGTTLSFYKNDEIIMQNDIITDALPYDDISRLNSGIVTSDFERACGVWESFIE